jgi:hypothetical protein
MVEIYKYCCRHCILICFCRQYCEQQKKSHEAKRRLYDKICGFPMPKKFRQNLPGQDEFLLLITQADCEPAAKQFLLCPRISYCQKI